MECVDAIVRQFKAHYMDLKMIHRGWVSAQADLILNQERSRIPDLPSDDEVPVRSSLMMSSSVSSMPADNDNQIDTGEPNDHQPLADLVYIWTKMPYSMYKSI